MIKVMFISLTLFTITCQTSLSQSDTLWPSLKGYDDFKDFVVKKLEYPTIAMENGISGTLEYAFIINKKGCIDSIKILSSPDQSLSDEIIRVLNKTKCKWIPGSVNGIPRELTIHSKIEFNLQVTN